MKWIDADILIINSMVAIAPLILVFAHKMSIGGAAAPVITAVASTLWDIASNKRREAKLKRAVRTLFHYNSQTLNSRTVYFYLDTKNFEQEPNSSNLNARRRKKPFNLERVFELFGLIFSPRIRDQIYEPFTYELREDYLEAKKRFRTPWAKRWILFCISVRFVGLILVCFKEIAGVTILILLKKVIGFEIMDALRKLLARLGN